MPDLKDPSPEDLDEIRAILSDSYPIGTMGDTELVGAMKQRLDDLG
jgi:hypothetical protein